MKVSDIKEGTKMYAVMQIPRFAKHGKLRMSPEVFESREKAIAYVEECRRREFLTNKDLWIVDLSSNVIVARRPE